MYEFILHVFINVFIIRIINTNIQSSRSNMIINKHSFTSVINNMFWRIERNTLQAYK